MSYGYADGPNGQPLYGSSTSSTDPTTGYTHTHGYYADAYGGYERSFDEERGPAFDRTYQITQSYASGVYETDVLSTATPLDGVYASYGTRYSSTYDLADHTATTDETTFSSGYSFSAFHSTDYATGATVASYDTRYAYAGGYYEYTWSTYAGPGGTTTTAGGAYHATG